MNELKKSMQWESTLGILIRNKRKGMRMTQAEFGQLLDVTQPTVCNYEYGHLGGDMRLALALATALDLPKKDIVLAMLEEFLD